MDEHLGTKIPLDITFRDESGAPVLLADLVNGPTIILPVYYSCSNVCFTCRGVWPLPCRGWIGDHWMSTG